MFQIVIGLGFGPNFQAPLIALQSLISPRDIATATSTFGFTRNLSTSVSIVVGNVIFQNSLQTQQAQLIQGLGPQNAQLLTGGSAGANVMLINNLPPAQRDISYNAMAYAIRQLWYLYVAIAAVGLLGSFFISELLFFPGTHPLRLTLHQANKSSTRPTIKQRRAS